MLISRLVTCCVLAASCVAAHAFERPFPNGTKRAVMTVELYPSIQIDGKARLLSAGSRIWNQDNLIVMPATLYGSQMTVHYTADMEDRVDRVWILSDEELKRPAPKPIENQP